MSHWNAGIERYALPLWSGCVLALGLIATLPASHARAEWLQLEVAMQGLDPHDRRFDTALRSGAVPQYQVLLHAPIALGFGVEGSYTGFDVKTETGSYIADLVIHGATVGMRWSLPISDFSRFYVRATALMYHGRLDVNLGRGALRASDWTPGVLGAAGFDLTLPTSILWGDDPGHVLRDFTIGVFADLGYAWAADFEFTGATPRGITGAGSHSGVPVDLGGFSLSGAVLRAGALVRF